MKRFFRKICIVVVFLCTLLLVPTGYATETTETEDKTYELNKFYIIGKGETLSILSELYDESLDIDSLQFKSSSKKIAKINKKGIIIGKKTGSTRITIRNKETNEVIASTKIYVGKIITRLRLNTTKKKIDQGKYFMLKASIGPGSAAYKKLQYTSSDSDIASVSSKGKVIGKQEGTATITVSTLDGSNISKTCIVTVLSSSTSDDDSKSDSTFPNPFFQNNKPELQGSGELEQLEQ